MHALHPAEFETCDLHAAKVTENTLMEYLAPDVHDDAPERFEILADQLSDVAYWRWLASLWVYHDRVSDRLATWRRLFGSGRPQRRALMTEDELEILDGLPSQVELFRGFCHRGGEDGVAWALQRDFAETFACTWFAMLDHSGVPDRYRAEGLFVARAVVPRQSVIACFQRESTLGAEIIVIDKIRTTAIERIDVREGRG